MADYAVLRSKIATLSGFPIKNRNVKALDKNFLDSTYTSLYSLAEYDKKGPAKGRAAGFSPV